MLKLRDFLHLPQLDALVNQLVADETGMVILAGIEARPASLDAPGTITPSGLSAIFNILMQEILLARPLAQAVIIAEERALARVPRQFSRRVRLLRVETPQEYAQQIDIAARQRPGLLVIESLTQDSAEAAFRAAESGVRVLAQLDSVLRGAPVGHQILEMGVPRGRLPALHWVLTNQRMSVLCARCKRPVEPGTEPFDRLRGRYPHLAPVIDRLLHGESAGGCLEKRAVKKQRAQFYRAGTCDRCRGTGYEGDIAVFDIFRNDPQREDFFTQESLLSLEEYALHLAASGELDLDDLLDLESHHLRRTYQLLASSERKLTETNTALNRKLFELEASNRVLVQRTEVLMSLQDLGQALITSTDLADLATRICRRAGELCGADRVTLYFRRADGEEASTAEILALRGWDSSFVGQRLELHHLFDPQEKPRITRYMQSPPGIHPVQLALGEEAQEKQILMGLRVPLVAQERQVGAMIVQCTQKDHFTPGETALLQTFANQAALAIQRAGLVEELRAKISQLEQAQADLVTKERMERELELARQVQQSMLPQRFPEVSGYALSARNEPARQVGGDFYDVILLNNDHFGVVIADVADKGLPAALYMALTRSLLLAEARRALSPREVLENINRLLLELAAMGGFVSIFYGVVDRPARQMVYARAGHERPLLLRNGEIRQLPGEGAVLGILEAENLNLSEETVSLSAGDRIILFTDGLTDVADADGRFSGRARLETLLLAREELPADQICNAIFSDLASFQGQAEQFDDMTLLVLEVQ
jgi:serine phosphatase RsbU (regulator of sigma subunit)